MGIYVFEKLQGRDTKGLMWMKNRSGWSFLVLDPVSLNSLTY